MKKRKVTLLIMLFAFMFVCVTMLCACKEEIIPKEIELELINPNTGEVIIGGERIDLPEMRTYIEVRIKDKEIGVYLTDEDLFENTVKGSYHARFSFLGAENRIYTPDFWPPNSELNQFEDYQIEIIFDCKPTGIKDSKFQRKYKTTTKTIKLYSNNKLVLEEDKLEDVYAFAEKTCPISFTAPSNGIYTIETYGDVKNEFICDIGEIENKADSINQKLIVELKEGDVLNFETKNVSLLKKIYQIKAEFTPTEITLGETKSLTIRAGEEEYVAFYPTNNDGFIYTLSSVGDYFSAVYLNSRNNIVSSESNQYKQTNAIATGVVGKYFISIMNNSDNDISIGISLSASSTLPIGQTNDTVIGHNGLYKLTSRPAACFMVFRTISLAPTKTTLLDENLISLRTSDVALDSNFGYVLEQNKTYYLLINSQNLYDVIAQISIEENPIALVLGNNSFSKTNNSMTCKFTTKTSAEYSFGASDNIKLSVYSSSWEIVNTQDGKYFLNGETTYYIVARGSASAFNLSISFDYTESFNGLVGPNGYKFIRFIPSITDFYDVNGISECVWLTNSLSNHYGVLYANQTYFLKITDDANAAYDIDILRRALIIQENYQLILSARLYLINIADADDYVFITTKANGVTATFNILNSQRQIVFSDIEVGGEYIAHLDAGANYVEITSTDSVGFQFYKLDSD